MTPKYSALIIKLSQLVKIVFIAILILIVTLLHYSTKTSMPHWHEVYKTLYFIPIILAAFWYDLAGALTTSLIISLVYLPHVIFQWGGSFSFNSSRILMILLYNIIALVTGYLAQREKQERARYQEAAEKLDDSYERLKAQSDQLRLIEEKLRQTERLSTLGELTASLAHEVRNPLGSIKGVAEILSEEYAESGKNREFVDILQTEVSRLNEVVGNYLNFARTNRVQKKPTNIVEVLQSTLALVRVKINHAGIRMRIHLPEEEVPVLGDEHLLRQALLNLVLNAINAMPNGGDLAVNLNEKEELVEICLKDSGTGIPRNKMKDIFRVFYTTRESGTGLGLPISKRIIEEHGGKLLLKSEYQKGTQAIIILPKMTENHS
ncbi:MAG: sensor histidine kinase [Calditrichaeota bacterium]|nr:sensor histidine kinase [Calditrichota bacterium]